MIKFVIATRNPVIDSARFMISRVAERRVYPHVVIPNNRVGLGEVYNSVMKEATSPESILYPDDVYVFMHDDVYIKEANLREVLLEATAHFPVVGLAGTSRLPIKSTTMWHHSPEKYWSGSVTHPMFGTYHGDDIYPDRVYFEGVQQLYVNSYGPTPQQCVVVDGLFIAVKPFRLLQEGVTFDPQFNFHYYDLDFCLSAHKAGLRIGTWPINVIHQSPGLWNPGKGFFSDRDKFTKKWGPKGEVYTCSTNQ